MSELEENIGEEKFSSDDENFLPNGEVSNSVEDVLSVDAQFEKIPKEDLKFFHEIYKQYGKGENYKAKTLAWLSVKSSFEGVSLGMYYQLVIEQLWWKNFDRESILLIGDIFFHSKDTWETFLVIRDLINLEFSDVNFKEVLKQIREYHPRNVLIDFLRREFGSNTKREEQRYRIRLLLQSPTKFYENILSRFLRWSDKEIHVWKNDEDFFFKNIESVTDVDRKKNIEIVNQYQFELLEKNDIISSDRKLILYCRTDQWGQSAEYFYLVLRQLQNYIKNNSKLFNVIEIVSRGGGRKFADR